MTSETKQHTLGPWQAGRDGNNRVYGPDGHGDDSGLIAEVFKGRGNINLIAAAPDLLAALKEAEQDVSRYGRAELAKRLRALIATAEPQ